MALCVQLLADGTLDVVGVADDSCHAFVLMSGPEFQSANAINELLGWPEPAVAMGWFVGAFGFVLGSFLIGRITGTVSNMFN